MRRTKQARKQRASVALVVFCVAACAAPDGGSSVDGVSAELRGGRADPWSAYDWVDPAAVAAASAGTVSPAVAPAEPNYGIAAPAPRDERTRARDTLLVARARRLEACRDEVYAALAALDEPDRSDQASDLFETIIGADEIDDLDPDAVPTDAEEEARLDGILREGGVR
jgi:hypothetical protein